MSKKVVSQYPQAHTAKAEDTDKAELNDKSDLSSYYEHCMGKVPPASEVRRKILYCDDDPLCQ